MAAIALRKGGSIGARKSLAQISTARHILQSSYDKNPEDGHPTSNLLPDDVISGQPPEKYWAPHPKTGVFGPPEKAGGASRRSSPPLQSASSALEQQAWFRTNGDVDIDKNVTHHHSGAELKEAREL